MKCKSQEITIGMAEVLKKYDITYKDARAILIMLSKIIDRTKNNYDSLYIKMTYEMPAHGCWVSEQSQ